MDYDIRTDRQETVKEEVHTTDAMRADRRSVVAGAGGVAALLALQAALGRSVTAQDATPGASPEAAASITVTPPADCEGQDQVAQNLETFDRLDFVGWNEPNWDVFAEIHAEDVIVEGFGISTQGRDVHVEWAKEFIAANPDTYVIEEHPIRLGVGDWTAVTGRLVDGTVMATIAHWQDGQITEEYLFSLVV